MQLTKKRLKQIISEELDRMEEIKNDAVQLATLQRAVDQEQAVNNSSDGDIIKQIEHNVNVLAHLVSGLSDGSIRGACMGPLNSFQNVFDQIRHDVDDRPSSTPNQWGESETAPE